MLKIFFWLLFIGYIRCTTTKLDSTTTTMKPLPPVDPNEILYHLYNRKYLADKSTLLKSNDPKTYCHLKGKIYFFMHGWKETPGDSAWFKPMTEIILKRYPYASVIHIDWSKHAEGHYENSVAYFPEITKYVGDFIAKIHKCNDFSKEIGLFGNSLGGQLIALIAKRFKHLTGKKVSRIISMDPAGREFENIPPEKRLIADDAENVVVLHTDEIFGVGNINMGHMDFYPNGGIQQPGCPFVKESAYDFRNALPGVTDPVWCHHLRVNEIMIEALRSPIHFMARKCEDYESFKNGICDNKVVSLGDLESTARGSFYFDTTGEKPFYEKEKYIHLIHQ